MHCEIPLFVHLYVFPGNFSLAFFLVSPTNYLYPIPNHFQILNKLSILLSTYFPCRPLFWDSWLPAQVGTACSPNLWYFLTPLLSWLQYFLDFTFSSICSLLFQEYVIKWIPGKGFAWLTWVLTCLKMPCVQMIVLLGIQDNLFPSEF